MLDCVLFLSAEVRRQCVHFPRAVTSVGQTFVRAQKFLALGFCQKLVLPQNDDGPVLRFSRHYPDFLDRRQFFPLGQCTSELFFDLSLWIPVINNSLRK